MKVTLRCTCGFPWTIQQNIRELKVTVPTATYIPPCPTCGKNRVEVIVSQEDDEQGTLEIESKTGGNS